MITKKQKFINKVNNNRIYLEAHKKSVEDFKLRIIKMIEEMQKNKDDNMPYYQTLELVKFKIKEL